MRCGPPFGPTSVRSGAVTPRDLGEGPECHGTKVRAFGSSSLTYPDRVGPDELLPEQTMDDVDPGDPREESDRDAWLREQVPPHHG